MNQIKTILSVIIITALLLGSDLPFGEQPAAAADGEELDLPPIELPEKGNPKLDSQLNQLASAQTSRKAASLAQQSNIELVAERVRVIVECLPDQLDVATKAVGDLGIVETSYRNLLQVTVPITNLNTLADVQSISLVRLPQYPLPAAVSEGVALINANIWQTAGYTGTGVKVAILDVGFTGYSSLLGTELPASVTTQSFLTGSDIEGSSNHGTTCAEVVYDIAPDTQFYLANFGTEVELGNAVDWLIAQGIDVISASLGSPFWGPGDGTGTVCEMFDAACTAGILSAVAMHNLAQRHWQGDFVDINADGWHEFAPGDATNGITAYSGQTIAVGLKWDDTWGASGNDYDLYLFDQNWTLVDWSVSTQDGNDNPYEWITYTAAYSGSYHIAVNEYSSTQAVNFHLYCYDQTLQYLTASSSFTIPADSPSVMSIGAVSWDNPTALMSYSSRGPTEDNRVKPDLVAPTNVSATSSGGTFGGTSAATPHAAGAAALVKQRYPSYTPAQIQSFLEGRAVDLGAGGKDNLFGSGRLDLGSPPGLTPPSVTTSAATSITSTSATLNGNLTSKGTASTVYASFEYGPTTAYGQETTPQEMPTTGPYSFNLTSLLPDTPCHFRAKAVGDGTSYGSDKSFTTLPTEVPPTTSATRTLPASVGPGANFDVGIVASGCGQLGEVAETLPAGFSYVGTTSTDVFVTQVGNLIRFSFMGDGVTFDYTVTASTTEGPYSFAGVVKDEYTVEYPVGGDSTITVGVFDPWNYDLDEDGVISKMEALTAVVDYFSGLITKQQALAVIVLYFAT